MLKSKTNTLIGKRAKKYAENAGGVEFGAIYTAYINGAQSKFKKP